MKIFDHLIEVILIFVVDAFTNACEHDLESNWGGETEWKQKYTSTNNTAYIHSQHSHICLMYDTSK